MLYRLGDEVGIRQRRLVVQRACKQDFELTVSLDDSRRIFTIFLLRHSRIFQY